MKFATLGADLGTLVTSSDDKWTTTKAWIVDNLEWSTNEFIKSGEFATYAFDIKIPTDLTAFIAPFTPDFDEYPEVADQIIYIEQRQKNREKIYM